MDAERVVSVPLPTEENIFLSASCSFCSASSELFNYNHIMLDKQNNAKHLWSATKFCLTDPYLKSMCSYFYIYADLSHC
jgi:hypothetical protein